MHSYFPVPEGIKSKKELTRYVSRHALLSIYRMSGLLRLLPERLLQVVLAQLWWQEHRSSPPSIRQQGVEIRALWRPATLRQVQTTLQLWQVSIPLQVRQPALAVNIAILRANPKPHISSFSQARTFSSINSVLQRWKQTRLAESLQPQQPAW